jgi:hypothetical protein
MDAPDAATLLAADGDANDDEVDEQPPRPPPRRCEALDEYAPFIALTVVCGFIAVMALLFLIV